MPPGGEGSNGTEDWSMEEKQRKGRWRLSGPKCYRPTS